jgi:hypothetical protein
MPKKNPYVPKRHQVASQIVAEWQAVREEIRTLDRAHHPDIIDRHGRAWVWRWDDSYGSQYAHCGSLVSSDRIGGVSQLAGAGTLNNQNYDLCAVCLDGRTRNITPCKPEWKCTHRVCAEMASQLKD